MILKPGDPAPFFSLTDDNGVLRSLSDYDGKPIVLYFYPKDNTPGCTKEACGFRDDYALFENAGVVILGISPDNEKSHAGFKLKLNLPFVLLSDVDHKVCELYGVWGQKKFMGKDYFGVLRTTFVIGPDGKIIKIFEDVKPSEHSKEVLASLNIQ